MSLIRRQIALAALIAVPLIGGAAIANAEENYFEVSGFAAGDVRVFPSDAIQAGQKDQKLNPSLVLQPEILYEWNDGDDRLAFTPFFRLDSHDDTRTHGDIRELSYLHIGDNWDVTVGIDKVFWGVMESRHLVDIINQTDGVEDADGEDKLGQPMINIGLQQDWGDINAYAMPYFRERTFPGDEGRLRGALVVDHDQAIYESSSEQTHVDLALRYATVLGDWDIGLAQFYGTSRDPRLVVGTSTTGDTVLVPHYDIISRSSVDIQATIEEWLWKMEGVFERADYDSFTAVSAGFEYTFFGSIGDAGDLGVLAEYHFDDRNDQAPATLYNNDLFFGGRITLNDEDDTDFLAGILFDPDSKAKIITMEADTRLSDLWSFEVEMRIYADLTPDELLYGVRQDDHIQMRFSRYF